MSEVLIVVLGISVSVGLFAAVLFWARNELLERASFPPPDAPEPDGR